MKELKIHGDMKSIRFFKAKNENDFNDLKAEFKTYGEDDDINDFVEKLENTCEELSDYYHFLKDDVSIEIDGTPQDTNDFLKGLEEAGHLQEEVKEFNEKDWHFRYEEDFAEIHTYKVEDCEVKADTTKLQEEDGYEKLIDFYVESKDNKEDIEYERDGGNHHGSSLRVSESY